MNTSVVVAREARVEARSTRVVVLRWSLVAIAVGVSLAGFLFRGFEPAVGQKREFDFTLVPLDRRNLECRGQVASQGFGCHEPSDLRRIVPVLTTSRALYLAAGLFADPAVRQHVTRAKPQQRFTAQCRVTMLEHVPSIALRFARNARFETSSAWLVRVDSCEVH